MRITKSKFGEYLTWYEAFDNPNGLSDDEIMESILDSAWAIESDIMNLNFLVRHWYDEVLVIEEECRNGLPSGSHDCLFVFGDGTYIEFDSIDYAFTPIEESEVV